jgi:hypothetical protein
VGTHPVTASYAAGGGLAGSTSLPLVQQVVNAATTTSVTSSVNPSVLGQSVTFTATVAVVQPGAGTPAGTVTFMDGSTVLGSATLSAGMATFSTTALPVGSGDVITARYLGNGSYAPSSATVTIRVTAPIKPSATAPIRPSAPAPRGTGRLASTGFNGRAVLELALTLLAAGLGLVLTARRRHRGRHLN